MLLYVLLATAGPLPDQITINWGGACKDQGQQFFWGEGDIAVGLGAIPLKGMEGIRDMGMAQTSSLLYPIPRYVSREARKLYPVPTLMLLNARLFNNKNSVL